MTALAAAIVATLRARTHAVNAWILAGLAELLTGLVLVVGWLLVTDAIAHLSRVNVPFVWRLSLGLLALSLAGWKFFGLIVWQGLYELTRGEEK